MLVTVVLKQLRGEMRRRARHSNWALHREGGPAEDCRGSSPASTPPRQEPGRRHSWLGIPKTAEARPAGRWRLLKRLDRTVVCPACVLRQRGLGHGHPLAGSPGAQGAAPGERPVPAENDAPLDGVGARTAGRAGPSELGTSAEALVNPRVRAWAPRAAGRAERTFLSPPRPLPEDRGPTSHAPPGRRHP